MGPLKTAKRKDSNVVRNSTYLCIVPHIVLLCLEYFGAERVTSGDEDKKHEEKEAESGEEGKAARAIPNVFPSKSDPE